MRNKLVRFILAIFWVVVLGRMGYVQLVRGGYYRARAAEQHTDSLRLAARRGRILDHEGRALTLNQTSSVVYVWPQKLKSAASRDSLAELFEEAGLGTKREMAREFEQRQEMFALERRLEPPAADALWRTLVRRRFGDRTAIEQEIRRRYPYGEAFGKVVGFVAEDGGMAGVECWYDSALSGRPGWVLMQKEGSGLEMPYPSYPRVEPVPGVDVYLSLDADVQEICYRALAASVKETGAKQGSVVVLDANDAAILGMADYPSFDPKRFKSYPTARYRCAAVADEFEPGSSFKIVVAAAALESPNADEFTSRQYDVSSGMIEVMGRKIGDVHKHGVLTFDELLVKSSNPGCAMVALQLDQTLFYLTARNFGFGEPIGIGLPGEATGRIDKPAKLNPLRIANNSFGQGLTVTLLQMAAAYQCIANDGYYNRPYLVRTIRAGKRVLKHTTAGQGRRALKPETARRLKDILARVVSEGTGTMAKVPGVEVCGKTGTAQKIEPGRGYSDTRSIMSFIGFLPKERPRYVIGVVLDEPTHRFAGTSVCPVFREVAEQLLALERVRNDDELAGRSEGKGRQRRSGS